MILIGVAALSLLNIFLVAHGGGEGTGFSPLRILRGMFVYVVKCRGSEFEAHRVGLSMVGSTTVLRVSVKSIDSACWSIVDVTI